MRIKNFDDLAKTEERRLALEMLNVGLEAIDTHNIIKKEVRLEGDLLKVCNEDFLLDEIERLFVVGVGKCSLAGAEALEEILGDYIDGGIVIDVRGGDLKKIKSIRGDHPMPTEVNVRGTEEIIECLKGATEKDLVLFIISGGGSTLLCQPESMTCFGEAEILTRLFKGGFDIRAINTIRKHLSSARGGFLAKYAYPAKVVSLIFSDVPGDDLEFIASGPTVMDTTTKEDAKKILERCGVDEISLLVEESLVETPKEAKYFENVKNVLVMSNRIALSAMERYASKAGFNSHVKATALSGNARDVARDILTELHDADRNTVFLYGGETTVTITNEGKGGRNQELVLSGLLSIREDELLVSFASDGSDHTDFAGAMCDIITKKASEEMGLDVKKYLEGNHSYDFFKKLGDFIITGDTGINASDLMIAIKK